jgi:dephospho-CoA kinase
MKLFGLTGGVGMGKSTSAKFLTECGVAVVDTDAIARQLVEPGQPALLEIEKAFGRELIGADGKLRRDELARRVFSNVAERQQLEKILHPQIRAAWQEQVAAWRDQKLPSAVVVIPLLFETNAAGCFDAIICIACSALMQKKRLQGRGWDETQIEQRIAAQWPTGKKMDFSNYVVWTEGSLEAHREQIESIVQSSPKISQ